jgi:hypothetical protein
MTSALATLPVGNPRHIVAEEPMLPLTIRHADGREETIERAAREHRAMHLEALHASSSGFVEIAAGRRGNDGDVHIYTRQFKSHFLPGGGSGDARWRDPLLRLAERHANAGEEVFVGPAPRARRRGAKEATFWTRVLWMDLDPPGFASEIDRLLERFPAHLEIATAGGDGDDRDDGHRHLLWLLDRPQVARTVVDLDTGEMFLNALEVTQGTGKRGRPRIVGYSDLKSDRLVKNAEATDWIERWNLRLIGLLGKAQLDGRERYIADVQCRERARVLRLAGTVNRKTGRHARIARLDRALPAYSIDSLVGQLADPRHSRPVKRRDMRGHAYDALRLIPTSVYFPLFSDVEVTGRGNVHCPSPRHADRKPSCSVAEYVFHCFGCGAQGTIYDLWSLMNYGVSGDALASDEVLFKKVKSEVAERCRHLV